MNGRFSRRDTDRLIDREGGAEHKRSEGYRNKIKCFCQFRLIFLCSASGFPFFLSCLIDCLVPGFLPSLYYSGTQFSGCDCCSTMPNTHKTLLLLLFTFSPLVFPHVSALIEILPQLRYNCNTEIFVESTKPTQAVFVPDFFYWL